MLTNQFNVVRARERLWFEALAIRLACCVILAGPLTADNLDAKAECLKVRFAVHCASGAGMIW